MNTDRHANTRDRKRDKARKSKDMRGNRSVFVLADAAERRNRKLIERGKRDA